MVECVDRNFSCLHLPLEQERIDRILLAFDAAALGGPIFVHTFGIGLRHQGTVVGEAAASEQLQGLLQIGPAQVGQAVGIEELQRREDEKNEKKDLH